MKIIVTGVAGFIGSNLAKKLLEMGHRVTGVDNFSYGFERNIQPLKENSHFTFLYGDLCNPLLLKDHQADVIVHLASQKIPRYSSALRTLDENYLVLRNIIDKCLKSRTRIVFASSSDVYGKNRDMPFTEESDLVMGPTTVKRWAYALSKIYGEQYIIANHDEYNLDYTIVRFFGSYGPNQNLTWWGGPQSVFIGKAFKKEPLEIHGDGLQTRTFTYVDDTVGGLTTCIIHEKALNEIFNIATNPDEEITIADLGRLIWRLTNGEHDEPRLNFIPYSTFGKYEDVSRRVPCIDKMKKYFNFGPKITLVEGLIRTIKWQREILKSNP
jgi:UDP-glucose 4-epimerase